MKNCQSKPKFEQNFFQLTNAENTKDTDLELIVNNLKSQRGKETNPDSIPADDEYKTAISFFIILNDLFEKSTNELKENRNVSIME